MKKSLIVILLLMLVATSSFTLVGCSKKISFYISSTAGNGYIEVTAVPKGGALTAPSLKIDTFEYSINNWATKITKTIETDGYRFDTHIFSELDNGIPYTITVRGISGEKFLDETVTVTPIAPLPKSTYRFSKMVLFNNSEKDFVYDYQDLTLEKVNAFLDGKNISTTGWQAQYLSKSELELMSTRLYSELVLLPEYLVFNADESGSIGQDTTFAIHELRGKATKPWLWYKTSAESNWINSDYGYDPSTNVLKKILYVNDTGTSYSSIILNCRIVYEKI